MIGSGRKARSRSRRAWRGLLLAGGALLGALPSAAEAQNECGAPPPGGGTVTCPPSGNPYAGGISYGPLVEDLTVVLGPGVRILNPGSATNPNGVRITSTAAGADLGLQAGTDTRIETNAAGHDGVEVTAALGDVTVTVDHIVTRGSNSRAVFASSPGNVNVSANNVITEGVFSVGLDTLGTNITISSGSITTTGDNAQGIIVVASGNAEITSGTIETSGSGGIGIDVISLRSLIVSSGTVVTRGDSAIGIDVASCPLGGPFDPALCGSLSLDSGTVTTSGANSQGIFANGLKNVEVSSEAVDTAGDSSIAIVADSTAGNVTLSSGRIATQGDGATGILAFAGDGSYQSGIGDTIVISDGGDVVLTNTEFVETNGDDAAGIVTFATGNGAVTIGSARVTTRGDQSTGIDASTADGDLRITSDTVATGGTLSNGIFALAGRGNVTVGSTSITTAGAESAGIVALSRDGDATVTSGTISTVGGLSNGITVNATRLAEISSGTVTTAGQFSIGIFAARLAAPDGDSTGGVVISSDSVTTGGLGAAGIFAFAAAGGVDITSTGAVRTTGASDPSANATGIFARANIGSVLVDAADVDAGGAGSHAIHVFSTTGSNVTVRGLVQSGSGLAIQADNGATAISTVAGGTIRGRVDLTDNADRIDNAGLFDAIGNSAFGSGADTFINTGTTRSVNGTASLDGLEHFNNPGVIDLVDGAGGDQIDFGGDLVFGADSGLRVDVTPERIDSLTVAGVASLAGTLTLVPNGANFLVREGDTYREYRYDLVTATGGLAGTFSGDLVVTGSFDPLHILQAGVRYEADRAILLISLPNVFETFSTSFTETVTHQTQTIRVDTFSTRILGRLTGGTPLFDQTYALPFTDPQVQAGLDQARLAITDAGGPGVVIDGPTRIERTETQTSSTSSTTRTIRASIEAISLQDTIGPATVQVGDRGVCATPGGDDIFPSGCERGTDLFIPAGHVNINSNVNVAQDILEVTTTTNTFLISETWELTGTVTAIGTIHAAAQSGLFDLAGRLLHRVGAEGAPGLFGEAASEPGAGASSLAGSGAGRGWAETYGFRIRADARGGIPGERRDAWGFAGGFSYAPSPDLTFGFGLDHGRLDLDVPAANESADIELTQVAAGARIGGGPFSLSLAASYGFGEVESRRALLGSPALASYDVRLLGLYAEARWRIEAGAWRIVPLAGIDHARVDSDAFVETGPLGLVAADHDSHRTRLFAGVELGAGFGAVDLTGSARYLAVVGGEERTLPVAFALAPAMPLVMRGLDERDSLLVGAQARVRLGERLSLYLAWDGRFAGCYDAHSATAGLRLRF